MAAPQSVSGFAENTAHQWQGTGKITDHLRSPKKKSTSRAFWGAASVLGSLGWMDCVWPGLCVAGRIANWQIPWEGSVPRRGWGKLSQQETSWPTCTLCKEAGVTIFKLQYAWLLFSYSWLRIPRSKDAKLTWEDPWILLHSIKLEKTKHLRRWKTKEQLTSDIGFCKFFELRKLEADTMQKAQPGCLSFGLSWAVLNISYINGVVPLMVDLFPTSWESVSILKGITEALAAEDVATFCRNHEAPILHNLRISIHADWTPDRIQGPGSFILGALRSVGSC